MFLGRDRTGMRQGNSNKRMRGRGGGGGGGGNNNGGGRKGPNPLSRTYESTGPDVKIRGTALHIAEKYVSLARDAQSSGDPVLAENYLQHAEHYYRIIAAAQAAMPQPVAIVRSDIQTDEEEEEFEEGSTETARVEPRAEPRRTVDEDGYMPVDAPQPFLDEMPTDGRSGERTREERPRGDRDRSRGGRGFRNGPRGDRPEPAREGGRAEGQRPPRGERPQRVEIRADGERSEAEGDLSALPAFLTATPTRVAPAPAQPAPSEAPQAAVEAVEAGAEETPKRRTRGGRGRGRRPEYEAGSAEAEGAAAPVVADE